MLLLDYRCKGREFIGLGCQFKPSRVRVHRVVWFADKGKEIVVDETRENST